MWVTDLGFASIVMLGLDLTDSVREFLRIGHRLVLDWGILSVIGICRHLSYSRAISRSQHGFSLALQTFHEYLGIVRLDPNFFQG